MQPCWVWLQILLVVIHSKEFILFWGFFCDATMPTCCASDHAWLFRQFCYRPVEELNLVTGFVPVFTGL
uniref:Uncharacterized protein n=1 Tax=Aegilops tauschii subsp. strangulata TaxID=200361 RepID=A0A452XGW6_AEGTS